MTNYMEIALTPTIMDVQKEKGSFGMYGHVAEGDHEHPIELSADELDMIVPGHREHHRHGEDRCHLCGLPNPYPSEALRKGHVSPRAQR